MTYELAIRIIEAMRDDSINTVRRNALEKALEALIQMNRYEKAVHNKDD